MYHPGLLVWQTVLRGRTYGLQFISLQMMMSLMIIYVMTRIRSNSHDTSGCSPEQEVVANT